ncbi:hypothetical protein [Mucilaginibacter sp.]
MKKIVLLATFVISFTASAFASDLDSLKQQLQFNLTDTAKACLYLKMAQAYLNLKSPNRVYRSRNSENAVNYSMLALHLYSKMEDTTGLKNSYSSLGKAYHAGHQYTQAKWFMIQSTILAKGQKDVPTMISSLIELANIKMESGEYKTAKKDLNYAMNLSSKYNLPDYQSDIAQGLVLADNGIKRISDDEDVTSLSNTVSGSSTIITEQPVIKSAKFKAVTKSNKYRSKLVKTNNIAVKKARPVSTENLASL